MEMTVLSFFKSLWTYFKPYKIFMFLIGLGVLLQIVYLIFVPFVYREIFDNSVVNKNVHLLLMLSLILIAGLVFRTLVDFGTEFLNSYLATKITNDIRLQLFIKLQEQDLAYFQATNSGEIISYFSNDLSAIEGLIVTYIIFIIKSLVMFFVSLSVMFWIQTYLALFSIGTFLLIYAISKKLTPLSVNATYERRNEEARFLNVISEFIGMQLIIRLYNLKLSWAAHVKGKLKILSRINIIANTLNILIPRFFTATVMAVNIVIIVMSAFMIIKGHLTIGTVFCFTAFMNYFMDIVMNMGTNVGTLFNAMGGMKRIKTVLDKNYAQTLSGIEPVEPLFLKDISFNHVSFFYTENNPILRDINFSIPLGQMIAFVGPSGSGKSTIFSLLLGLYSPQQGSVTFDGIKVEDLDENKLREKTSIVMQDNLLFNISIRENIRAGKITATDDEVIAVAKKVGLHETIMGFSEGYDTVIGERGGRLSGGQRQRLALARALIRNSALLLLDEVTSGLDPISDAEISHMIELYSKGRTTILVTHRLQSVIHADVIFVVKDGQLIESGSHNGLLQKNGLYAKMWEKQRSFLVTAKGKADINIEFLQKIALFHEFDNAILQEIVKLVTVETHKEGVTLFNEGSEGDKFYMISYGRVEVLKKTSESPNESERRIAILDEGDYFGEIALLKKLPRNATVRTLTDCTFLVLNQTDFNKILDVYPQIRKKLDAMVELRI